MNGVSPLRLADGDWQRLLEIVELPVIARDALEHILGAGSYFIKLESSARASHKTKKRLSELGAKAGQLAREIRRCEEDADLLHALMWRDADSVMEWASAPPTKLTELRSLQKHVASIESLSHWFETAQARVPGSKKGDKTEAIQGFVKDADWFLGKYTGRGLTRGYETGEAFLEECFRHLGVSTSANAAVKRFASDRRGKVHAENS